MIRPISITLAAMCMVAIRCEAAADSPQGGFAGWQGMRVINQEGTPSRLIAADLDADGRDELLAVNTRNLRIDVYRWLAPHERGDAPQLDPTRPNELPLAPDWSYTEIDLDEMPLDVAVANVDADPYPELVVLTAPSNRIVLLKAESPQSAEPNWQAAQTWDLLPGTPSGRTTLLVRTVGPGQFEAMVSQEQGLQTLRLSPGSRPTWLAPRESRGRFDCRLADLDGDSDLDLLEWSSTPRQTLRWFRNEGDRLLPAQVFHDQGIQGLEVLPVASGATEVLLLGGSQEGVLRRNVLSQGEERELGRRDSAPLASGPWCGLLLDGTPALVSLDPAQPRFRVLRLTETGFSDEETYPAVNGIRALAAPAARPGTLLIWARDAAQLYEARWEGGRLTFPRPFGETDAATERRILELQAAGSTVWWAQRTGADVDLFTWPADQPEPAALRFSGLGARGVERVTWMGAATLLFQEPYAEAAQVARLDGDQVTVSAPAHLAKVDLAEFRLYEERAAGQSPALRVGRLANGVLQWLGDDLEPTDQVMLADGQQLASYVPLADGQAWALESGGSFVHHLAPDEAGVSRVTSSIKLPGGLSLTQDPALGLVLVDSDRLLRLSQGRPYELKLLESKDSRLGRPSGVREATIHRVFAVDVTGDGVAEVVMCDDLRHQLSVLSRTDEGFVPLVSWPVFEDRTYPYGGATSTQVAEPRAIVAFNADGDLQRDLAMLCHDRLLIYHAREVKE